VGPFPSGPRERLVIDPAGAREHEQLPRLDREQLGARARQLGVTRYHLERVLHGCHPALPRR
jgi:hypothetical protein